jgi:hypothetical protein
MQANLLLSAPAQSAPGRIGNRKAFHDVTLRGWPAGEETRPAGESLVSLSNEGAGHNSREGQNV